MKSAKQLQSLIGLDWIWMIQINPNQVVIVVHSFSSWRTRFLFAKQIQVQPCVADSFQFSQGSLSTFICCCLSASFPQVFDGQRVPKFPDSVVKQHRSFGESFRWGRWCVQHVPWRTLSGLTVEDGKSNSPSRPYFRRGADISPCWIICAPPARWVPLDLNKALRQVQAHKQAQGQVRSPFTHRPRDRETQRHRETEELTRALAHTHTQTHSPWRACELSGVDPNLMPDRMPDRMSEKTSDRMSGR